MKRLSNATLAEARVRRPAYDRAGVAAGVVHFGPGAFHRAHQAYYFDRMLERSPAYGVCAMSLRSSEVRDALAPQDGLYVLAERQADPDYRVIGSLLSVLTAPREPEAAWRALASPDLRLITATVTEKGYGLTTAGELDLDQPEIRADLAAGATPVSFVGWLVEGLSRRRALGLAPPVVISCDNLSDNGAKLGRAAAAFARGRGDVGLSDWIAGEVAFPNSMVDSITPATDDALRAQVADVMGLEDSWPVQRERFTQWVVEDRLRPRDADALGAAGVTVAGEVAPFERAKLRLLNGAHSTLAYVGLGLGHETVSAAMRDARLASFVERMMREDIAPTLGGFDADAYIGQVLARFRNPAIVHKLSQIAWDGSQKLRFRLLETVRDALASGRPTDRLCVGVAAWMLFVRRQTRDSVPIVDPLADTLAEVARACDGSAEDVGRFLTQASIFPAEVGHDPRFREALTRVYAQFQADPGALSVG